MAAMRMSLIERASLNVNTSAMLQDQLVLALH